MTEHQNEYGTETYLTGEVMKTTKPGFKTTEFWISIVTIIIGALAAGGYITSSEASELSDALAPLAGAIVTGLAACGYAVSRGLSKK